MRNSEARSSKGANDSVIKFDEIKFKGMWCLNFLFIDLIELRFLFFFSPFPPLYLVWLFFLFSFLFVGGGGVVVGRGGGGGGGGGRVC